MNIALYSIGRDEDDLRFSIRAGGRHAGGITIHSVMGSAFSYGIAVAPAMRRQGVARAALVLLFAQMKARGFTNVSVHVAPDNAASLALHRALGFAPVQRDARAVMLVRSL